jgi:hypothetical protein
MKGVRENNPAISDRTKALLADPSKLIELNDFINVQLRKAIAALSLEHFPTTGKINAEEFAKRVSAYEATISDLEVIVILLARWGNSEHLMLLENVFSRLAEIDKGSGGTVVWLRLGWYPLLVLMYAGGIAALSARRYEALHTLLATPVRSGQAISGTGDRAAILPTLSAVHEIADSFKLMPGHEKDRVARSEHLFSLLKPIMEDALFLGGSYEASFDRFELLAALAYAIFSDPSGERTWVPPGRFSWKHHNSNSPLTLLIAEVTEQGEAWPLLRTGLFGGQSAHLIKVANGYKVILDRQSPW